MPFSDMQAATSLPERQDQ